MTGREPLLREVRQTLTRALENAGVPSELDRAFACWIWPAQPFGWHAEVPSHYDVTNYRDVAQLAFACTVTPDLLGPHAPALVDGLRRLPGRAAVIQGTPAGFMTDSVALLGLALGAQYAPEHLARELGEWMASFSQDVLHHLPRWKQALTTTTLLLLGHGHHPNAEPSGSDIRFALTRAGLPVTQSPDVTQASEALIAGTVNDEELPFALAALRCRTLTELLHTPEFVNLSAPTVSDVLRLLRNLPSGLRRWPWEDRPRTKTSTAQRWDVQNEYHVQNMLYFLLAPIFPDLEDEFYFEPVGQKNPRGDLGIPALRLIIEVKFIRQGVTFSSMVEEIAADVSLYFAGQSPYAKHYDAIIPFVWDDSARTQEHHVLGRGLGQFERVAGTVVVSRPGNWPPRSLPSAD